MYSIFSELRQEVVCIDEDTVMKTVKTCWGQIIGCFKNQAEEC